VNLLFVALESPYPPHDGGRLRTYNLLKGVAQRHRVTFVTFCASAVAEESLSPLRPFCHHVLAVPRSESPDRSLGRKLLDLSARWPVALGRYRSPEMMALLTRLVDRGRYDVAHIDHIYLVQYLAALQALPVAFNHPDVECVAQRRTLRLRKDRYRLTWLLAWLEHRRWCRLERWAAERCDVSIAVSDRDARYFQKHVPGVPTVVVPNGVDCAYFQPTQARSDAPVLLFTGNMTYPPNADAMTWFCADVFPLIQERQPAVRLLIVGRDPGPEVRFLERRPGVSVTGTVPDVRPYFAQAAVYIVPLRAGGGTRLKILEAMAMGMPVVSTPMGCELACGTEILVADSPAEFSETVLQLLASKDLRMSLGQRARQAAVRRFGWATAIAALEEAYQAAKDHRALRVGQA
jgi:sugar transferase (PEP-CTERM/EpsH1 system associated)